MSKETKIKKNATAYLLVTNFINQSSGITCHLIFPAYQIFHSFKKAKQTVIEQAEQLQTTDSKFAIQPIPEDKDWKLHAIAHVYLNNDFKPTAENDNPDQDGDWFSATMDIIKLTTK